MKNYLIISLLSLSIISCTKEDANTETELHAIEYNESKTIVGDYNGAFSWSKNNSETVKEQTSDNQQGSFAIKYISKNSLEITSNITADLKYKVYEMKLAKVELVDGHLEYYFTGKAKGYAENVNSFAEMSLKTFKEKNTLSFYGCNSFDGVSGEKLHVFDAIAGK